MIIVFSTLQSFKPWMLMQVWSIDPLSNRLNYIDTLCNREIQSISANGSDRAKNEKKSQDEQFITRSKLHSQWSIGTIIDIFFIITFIQQPSPEPQNLQEPTICNIKKKHLCLHWETIRDELNSSKEAAETDKVLFETLVLWNGKHLLQCLFQDVSDEAPNKETKGYYHFSVSGDRKYDIWKEAQHTESNEGPFECLLPKKKQLLQSNVCRFLPWKLFNWDRYGFQKLLLHNADLQTRLIGFSKLGHWYCFHTTCPEGFVTNT